MSLAHNKCTQHHNECKVSGWNFSRKQYKSKAFKATNAEIVQNKKELKEKIDRATIYVLGGLHSQRQADIIMEDYWIVCTCLTMYILENLRLR